MVYDNGSEYHTNTLSLYLRNRFPKLQFLYFFHFDFSCTS